MNINRWTPFVFVYFFLNSIALPYGLTYTTIFAPVFYVWIILERKKEILLPFLAILLPFIIIQLLYLDIVRKPYFISLLNLVLVYISCQAVYTFLLRCSDIEKIFRQILIVNFCLCLVAIAFYFTGYWRIFWMEQSVAQNVSKLKRLKMFTYEPSFYALLFVPLFTFYFLQYFFAKNSIRGWLLLPMIFLPLVLSFSIGVIAALTLAIIITFIANFLKLIQKRRILNAMILLGSVALLVWPLFFFLPESPLVTRIENIFMGVDVSGRGRTVDAYILAAKMVAQKNEFWGIGLGQVKIMGADVIREYYLYYTDAKTAIPNAVAETFAVFGWVGVAVRIFLQFFFFYYTKVWRNYYRLILFLFVFIYQFTGSFVTNLAEYVIWIFAFTHIFDQFDIKNQNQGSTIST